MKNTGNTNKLLEQGVVHLTALFFFFFTDKGTLLIQWLTIWVYKLLHLHWGRVGPMPQVQNHPRTVEALDCLHGQWLVASIFHHLLTALFIYHMDNRWHHWFNGHELGQILGNSEGQGSLACCSLWGCEESDTTWWLENSNGQ